MVKTEPYFLLSCRKEKHKEQHGWMLIMWKEVRREGVRGVTCHCPSITEMWHRLAAVRRSFNYELQPGEEVIVQELGDLKWWGVEKIVLHRAGKRVWNGFWQSTVDSSLQRLKSNYIHMQVPKVFLSTKTPQLSLKSPGPQISGNWASVWVESHCASLH